MIKVYMNRIQGFIAKRSILVSASESRVKLHSIGEIPVTDIRTDDPLIRTDESVLLLIKADAPDDALVNIVYPSGVENLILVWKLKAACTEIIRIIDTGTTLGNEFMFISK